MKKVVSIYVDPEAYEEMKRICHDLLDMSVSAELNELIKQFVQEHTGKKFEEAAPVDYEGLKRRHFKMVKELDRLDRHLEKKEVADELHRRIRRLKLDTEKLGNLSEVAPKLLDEWTRRGRSKEDAHVFIHYLELVQAKKQIELRLDELRRLEDIS
jgi:hypothetical protein